MGPSNILVAEKIYLLYDFFRSKYLLNDTEQVLFLLKTLSGPSCFLKFHSQCGWLSMQIPFSWFNFSISVDACLTFYLLTFKLFKCRKKSFQLSRNSIFKSWPLILMESLFNVKELYHFVLQFMVRPLMRSSILIVQTKRDLSTVTLALIIQTTASLLMFCACFTRIELLFPNLFCHFLWKMQPYNPLFTISRSLFKNIRPNDFEFI